MEKLLTADHAAAHAVQLCRPQVLAVYPVIAQMTIIEKLAQFCESGELAARLLEVESEHSAIAACVAAAAAGARTFTATTEEDLATRHEMLHWTAGTRQPVVMISTNEAISGLTTLQTDQTHRLGQRDIGWLQFSCGSAQEVLDTMLQAYRVAEAVHLPATVRIEDGLSHSEEHVVIPEQADVDGYLPARRPAFRHGGYSLAGFTEPGGYFHVRQDMREAMERAIAIVQEADGDFQRRFGRGYGIIEDYRLTGATVALIATGPLAGPARLTVDALHTEGIAAGLLRVRLCRPFPKEAIRTALAGIRRVIVLERNGAFGQAGICGEEVRAALRGVSDSLVQRHVVEHGGAAVSADALVKAFKHAVSYEPADPPERGQ